MTDSGYTSRISAPLIAIGAIAVLAAGVLIGLGVEMNSGEPMPVSVAGASPAPTQEPEPEGARPPVKPGEPASVGEEAPPSRAEAASAETSASSEVSGPLDPEIEMALRRVDPPEPERSAAPSAVPAPGSRPLAATEEGSPIQVERSSGGVVVRAEKLVRRLQTLTADGYPTTKELELEGFDITIAGPGRFHQTRSYGVSDRAVLGADPGLADGLYKYSVSPRLQRVSSLAGKNALAKAEDGAVVLTADGRNALDPDLQAAAAMPRVEGSSGTFRIHDGKLVHGDAAEEADPMYIYSDRDGDL